MWPRMCCAHLSNLALPRQQSGVAWHVPALRGCTHFWSAAPIFGATPCFSPTACFSPTVCACLRWAVARLAACVVRLQVYENEYDLFLASDLNDRSEGGNLCQW